MPRDRGKKEKNEDEGEGTTADSMERAIKRRLDGRTQGHARSGMEKGKNAKEETHMPEWEGDRKRTKKVLQTSLGKERAT